MFYLWINELNWDYEGPVNSITSFLMDKFDYIPDLVWYRWHGYPDMICLGKLTICTPY